jgi:hypothetical protein
LSPLAAALAGVTRALDAAKVAVEQAARQPLDGAILTKSVNRTVKGDAVYDLRALLKVVPDLLPLGAPASYLRKILFLENWTNDEQVGTSLTGMFRGLGQFARSTWNSVRKEVRHRDNTIPDWAVGVHDPLISLKMVAFLYASNKRVFNKHFPEGVYSDEIAYLYHQQGASAARKFLVSGNLVYPGQSKKSLAVLDMARGRLTGLTVPTVAYPSWVS